MHLPELRRLLGNENGMSEKRQQAVMKNLHLVDWFLHRVERFIKHCLYKTLDAKWHWFRL